MPTDIIPADNDDTTTATAAPIHHCYLGGTSHHPAHTKAASQILAAIPDAPKLANASQAFTHRATRLMTRRGITQILAIDCGLAIHHTAHAIQPGARVLYTGTDAARNHPALEAGDEAAFMVADLRRPHGLLARAEEYNINLSQPLGVLLTGVLHHFTWAQTPHLQLAELTRRLAPGSYLALTHITTDGTGPAVQAAIEAAYAGAGAPVSFHKPLVIKHFFEHLHLINPGWTDITQWQANGQKGPTQPTTLKILAAVARKPPAPRPGR